VLEEALRGLSIYAAAIAAALLMAVVVAGAGTLAWYDGERLSVLATGHLLDRYGIALEIEQLERTYEWRPLITIKHLRVANAAATKQTLVDVGAASFRIRPWTLLFNPLTLEDVAINGVTVTVPVDEDGARYWDPLVTAVSNWFHLFDWSIRRFDLKDLRAESRTARGNCLPFARNRATTNCRGGVHNFQGCEHRCFIHVVK
jgi:hypothetical protein